jgi:Tol biopolymer transport system component
MGDGTTVFDREGEQVVVLPWLFQPDWSPVDPDLLVGIANRDGEAGIFTARPSTGESTAVVTELNADRPVWSPDGTQIAFVSGPGSGVPAHPYVVDADGGDLRRVSDVDSLYVAPDWAPDGSSIAFSSWDYGLYVVNSDGTGERRLDSPGDNRSYVDAQWSPDGQRIITSGMWLFEADGSGVRRVAQSGSDPRWSPIGSEIAFSDGSRIIVISEDGGSARVLTTGEDNEFDHRPVWSPDGSTLSFTREEVLGWPPPPILTIRYDRSVSPDSFRGAVGDAQAPCRKDRLVRVRKVRRGPDRLIGYDHSNRRGNWRVPARDVRGRFYAIALGKTAPDGTECMRAHSPTVRI